MVADPLRSTILVVDDSPENIDVLDGILRDEYTIKASRTGEKALRIATSGDPPDLILLDIMMPEMDGYEVCRRLKAHARTRNIPVIFVSAISDVVNAAKGFAAGCVDYIGKPVSPPLVRARVKSQLALYKQAQRLERKVQERKIELSRTQKVAIHGMAVLAEYRDSTAGGHIVRSQYYVRILAEHLMGMARFRRQLDRDLIELLFQSSALHDIGKVVIPDAILLKPGRLTGREFEEIKRHTLFWGDALASAEQTLLSGGSSRFLQLGRDIALTHHEKWDGSGYPYGLKGEAIPLGGRLMALADVYDALISKRIYKPSLSHSDAVEIITVGDGRVMPTHFDPYVLEAFLEHQERFRQIAIEHADYQEELRTLVE
ncbi:MAG: two-component system response regulator [Desulfopila sp.]